MPKSQMLACTAFFSKRAKAGTDVDYLAFGLLLWEILTHQEPTCECPPIPDTMCTAEEAGILLGLLGRCWAEDQKPSWKEVVHGTEPGCIFSGGRLYGNESSDSQADETNTAQAVSSTSYMDYADLSSSGSCHISKTEMRAISLQQLERVVDYFSRRVLRKEPFFCLGSRPTKTGEMQPFTIREPQEVNLYHLNTKLIKPATESSQCSMVEFMTREPQRGDYFVSHFWGEPVIEFVACLKQHAVDYGLESPVGCDGRRYHRPHSRYLGGRSPLYWVCAYGLCATLLTL